MLIKISGTPIVDITNQMGITAEQLQDLVTTPINVEFVFGTHHLIGTDLNPINAPKHLIDGFNHLPENIASVSHFIVNLF